MSGKERINVAVRVRPLSNSEREAGDFEAVDAGVGRVTVYIDETMRARTPSAKYQGQPKNFAFEHCFGPQSQTEELYNTLVRGILMSSVQGVNGTIFVYGQTGSGKTHTVTGPVAQTRQPVPRSQGSKSPLRRTPPKSGNSMSRSTSRLALASKSEIAETAATLGESSLVYLSLKDTFAEAERLETQGEKCFISLAYVEIYNEQIFDLLRETDALGEALVVAEDTERGEFFIKGSTVEIVTCLSEAAELVSRGQKARHFAATALNHNSSRSHTLLRLSFKRVALDGKIYQSNFNIVDLAGSERLDGDNDDDNARKERMNEGRAINKSLFFLTQIISLRGMQKPPDFIPYRNSALTKLLKNAIGGNAKTAVLLCVSGGHLCSAQSLGTLKFGCLAKAVVNEVKANVVSPNENDALPALLAEHERQIKTLTERLSLRKDDRELLGRISLLEEQKRFLTQKLSRLLLPPEEIETGVAKHCMAHSPAAGALDFFRTKRGHSPGGKALPESFFQRNREYTRELFASESHAALLHRKSELENQLVSVQNRLAESEANAQSLARQNDLLLRALRLALAENEPDHNRLSESARDALCTTTLAMLENSKVVRANALLAKVTPNEKLPYTRSEFGAKNLLDELRSIPPTPLQDLSNTDFKTKETSWLKTSSSSTKPYADFENKI